MEESPMMGRMHHPGLANPQDRDKVEVKENIRYNYPFTRTRREQADRGELAAFDPHATLARIRSRQATGTGQG